MLSSQCEFGGAMTERGRLPNSGCMARLALMVQKAGDVIRTGGFVVVALVTGETSARQASKLIVDMTIDALHRPM